MNSLAPLLIFGLASIGVALMTASGTFLIGFGGTLFGMSALLAAILAAALDERGE